MISGVLRDIVCVLLINGCTSSGSFYLVLIYFLEYILNLTVKCCKKTAILRQTVNSTFILQTKEPINIVHKTFYVIVFH